jgi:hypothetical protein
LNYCRVIENPHSYITKVQATVVTSSLPTNTLYGLISSYHSNDLKERLGVHAKTCLFSSKNYAFFPQHPFFFPRIWLSICLIIVRQKIYSCCLVCLWYRYRWYLYSPCLLSVIWTFHFITSRCIRHHSNPLLLCPNLQQVGRVCLSPTRGIRFNLLYTWKHIKNNIRFG